MKGTEAVVKWWGGEGPLGQKGPKVGVGDQGQLSRAEGGGGVRRHVILAGRSAPDAGMVK